MADSWYRVCLNTIVRKDVDLASERLRILPMGSKVFVSEIKGRRVRISQPIGGWCSLTSSNGDTILEKQDVGDADAPLQTPTQAKIAARQKALEQTKDTQQKAKLQQEIDDYQRAVERKQKNLESIKRDAIAIAKYHGGGDEKQELRIDDVVWLQKKSLGMGIIRYIGPVLGQDGTWVGLEFDEPIGDSDGRIKVPPIGEMGGFEKPVEKKHAAFVRSDKVKLITGFDWLEVFMKLKNELQNAKNTDAAKLVQ